MDIVDVVMPFEPHPQAEKRKRSAVALIKVLLANNKPEVLPAHIKELLSILLRKITEAEASKHKTRYQSQGAIGCSNEDKLRHDHVYQRSRMIDALLKAKPEDVDGILKDDIACTVTIDEHRRLAAFDHEYGWDRYRKAGLVVIDTKNGEPVI